jgi:hypothetical protein
MTFGGPSASPTMACSGSPARDSVIRPPIGPIAITAWSSTPSLEMLSTPEGEALDTRGEDDAEGRLGEWARLESTCEGGRFTARVDGVAVYACLDVVPSGGEILPQSEVFDWLVRKFDLQPLTEGGEETRNANPATHRGPSKAIVAGVLVASPR